MTDDPRIIKLSTNPMGFDWKQRISGGLALMLVAYFVGHTVYKSSRETKTSQANQQTSHDAEGVVHPSRTADESMQPLRAEHATQRSTIPLATSPDGEQRTRAQGVIRPMEDKQIYDPAHTTAVKNPRILFASASVLGRDNPYEFTQREIQAVNAAFPRAPIRVERNVTQNGIARLLTTNSFDIVLLGALVQRDGTVILELTNSAQMSTDGLSSEGLVKLLEVSGTKLLILASCDSVPLAARLSNRINMVAATGNLYVDYFQNWLEVFFRMLASSRPLPKAFAIAEESVSSRNQSRMALIEVRTTEPLTFASE